MLDASAINVYIIWMSLKPDWNASKSHKRKVFLTHLGKALTGVSEGPDVPQTSTSEEPPRKNACCSICPNSKDRKLKQFVVCAKKMYVKNI